MDNSINHRCLEICRAYKTQFILVTWAREIVCELEGHHLRGSCCGPGQSSGQHPLSHTGSHSTGTAEIEHQAHFSMSGQGHSKASQGHQYQYINGFEISTEPVKLINTFNSFIQKLLQFTYT